MLYLTSNPIFRIQYHLSYYVMGLQIGIEFLYSGVSY